MSAGAELPHYFLGVDGGGTGCRARIEDAEGTVLGQGLSGPATTRLGIDAAWASIAKVFGAAIEETGFGPAETARIRAGIGLAGIGRKGALEALRAIAHPFASIDFVSDGVGACLGAHSGQDGAIVIAGTGSIGLGFAEGRDLRVGGYGFPISDEGSGADLGRGLVVGGVRDRFGDRHSVLMGAAHGDHTRDVAQAVAARPAADAQRRREAVTALPRAQPLTRNAGELRERGRAYGLTTPVHLRLHAHN